MIALLAVVLLGLAGCRYLGGREVTVEFSSAHGIEAGQPVYFAGIRVGKTGEPKLVQGRAHVPVHLMRQHRDALPATTVFAISSGMEGSEGPCLVAHDAGAVLPPEVKASGDAYRGFANEFELALVVGAKRAREFLESLTPPSR